MCGSLVEGRHYYDAFVLGAECRGVVACVLSSEQQAAPTLTITTHKVTPTSASADKILYTLDGTDPRYSDTAQVVSGEIPMQQGQNIKAVPFVQAGHFTSEVARATELGA